MRYLDQAEKELDIINQQAQFEKKQKQEDLLVGLKRDQHVRTIANVSTQPPHE